MTGFVSLETRAFFETLIQCMGGVVVERETEADYVLTNRKEESRLSLMSLEKAHCKNYVM